MQILKCEPEEIENPHANPYNLASTQLRDMAIFEEGKQAVLDQMVAVDLDEVVEKWCGIKGINSFTQFLKEKL